MGLVLVAGFGMIPLQNSIERLRLTHASLEQQKKDKIAEHEQLKQLSEREDGEIEILTKRIPPRPEQEKLIRDLRQITKESGFTFTGLQFSKGFNSTIGAQQLSVSFSAEGSRGQIQNFLSRIEQNERFLGMETLSVQTPLKDNMTKVTLSVSLYSFFQE